MNRKSLGGLIVLNVALIFVLGLLSFAPSTADAQLGRAAGGDYIMVAGAVQGRENSAVYVTDLSNGTMMAVHYDQGNRTLAPVGGRNLSADFAAAAQAGGRR